MPEQLAPGQGWAGAADLVDWLVPYESLWQPNESGSGSWFCGGRLNAAQACVDRHAEADPERLAIRWEGEPGDRRNLTYAQLRTEVVRLARALRGLGVGQGDVVALHLGWVPETVVAMLACARIGAVHAVLPTALPGEALADRLEQLDARILFTQDGAWRHGSVLPLKVRADEALSASGGIEHTIVVRRTGMDVGWYEGDRWYHDLVAERRSGRRAAADEPVAVAAADPLLVSHLANRAGRPVAVTHGVGTLLVTAAALHQYGIAEGRTIWCAGDVSWLGVQTHGIYGPLACGATAVMYEGTLDVPTPARAWDIMRRHGVETLLTTPSVIRTMRGWAESLERPRASAALKRVVTLGEPVDASLREWERNHLGEGSVSVADGWGQMQLGGIVFLDDPVDGARLPDPGAAVVGPDGQPVADGEVGELVLTHAWAATMSAGDGPAAAATADHWTRVPGSYWTGDLVRRHEGRLEFLGRTDQVVSLHGQLVSLTEVKELLLDHPYVAHADVFERVDLGGGRHLAAAVVLAGVDADVPAAAVVRDLGSTVRDALGGIARPRTVIVLDRIGDELRGDERRRALAALPLPEGLDPRHVAWSEVLHTAAASSSVSHP